KRKPTTALNATRGGVSAPRNVCNTWVQQDLGAARLSLRIEHEVVHHTLALAVCGWFWSQHQLWLHRGGNIVFVVRVAREVQLGGEQLVTWRTNLEVQVGWTPGVPAGCCDELTTCAIGRNLVRRRANGVNVEASFVIDHPDTAQVPLRDSGCKL